MNEQLQNSVVEILNRAISGIDSSVEFMQAELPDVINQLLLWYAVKGAIIGVIGLALVITFVIVIKSALSGDYEGEAENSFWVDTSFHHTSTITLRGVAVIMLTFLGAVFGLFMAGSIMDTIQIWIAPKIWLMEYAASIVK